MVELSVNLSFSRDFIQFGVDRVSNETDGIASEALCFKLFFIGLDLIYYKVK